MQNLLKSVTVSLLPPLVARLLRRLYGSRKQQVAFEYVPEGWQRLHQTSQPIRGWDNEAVAVASAARWQAFQNAIRGPGPLGIVHEALPPTRDSLPAHNTILTYGYVLALAARCLQRMSILDWGGGLGHYALLSRALLPGVEIDYFCRDVPAFCGQGRLLAPRVTFYSRDDDFAGRAFDLVLASGALQYVQAWQESVRRLVAATGRYLLITRLPLVSQSPSFIMLQRAQQHGYPTEYLSWCFNRGEFLGELRSAGMELVREFIVAEGIDIPGAPEPCVFAGFLFRRSVEE